jgi:hypothetical protein
MGAHNALAWSSALMDRRDDTCTEDATASGGGSSGKSSGVFLGRLPVRNCRAGLDPYETKRRFPQLWAQFIRDNFRDSTQAAAAFGVNERTARLWMEGTNAPQGWAVRYALGAYPQAVKLLEDA